LPTLVSFEPCELGVFVICSIAPKVDKKVWTICDTEIFLKSNKFFSCNVHKRGCAAATMSCQSYKRTFCQFCHGSVTFIRLR